MPQRPRLIVFTGGPRGGKGETIAFLQTQLEREGIGVFTVPEMATVLMGMGFHPTESYKSKSALWDKARIQAQLAAEKEAFNAAKVRSGPQVILIDRGIPDGEVFCAPEIWQEAMSAFSLTSVLARERYDEVIHMVSTAVDLPGVYESRSNRHRYHTEAEARESDMRLGEIWQKHPNYHRLDNSVGILEKSARALPIVTATVKPGPMVPAGLGKVSSLEIPVAQTPVR